MAQKTQILLTCDLEDGDKPGTQTFEFSFEGGSYEIDLCDKHAKEFRRGMQQYLGAARRASNGGRGGTRRARSTGRGTSADRQRTQEIRAWARKKGVKVNERGRLSGDIVAQYEASGGK